MTNPSKYKPDFNSIEQDPYESKNIAKEPLDFKTIPARMTKSQHGPRKGKKLGTSLSIGNRQFRRNLNNFITRETDYKKNDTKTKLNGFTE